MQDSAKNVFTGIGTCHLRGGEDRRHLCKVMDCLHKAKLCTVSTKFKYKRHGLLLLYTCDARCGIHDG